MLITTSPVHKGLTTSKCLLPKPGACRAFVRYGGDAKNEAVSGLCNDAGESANVTLAERTITSLMSPSVPALA